MDNMEYKPNSNKYKEEQKEAVPEKRVSKVVGGTAKVKTNEMRKFADVFISEDVKNVKSYVLMDVLVPTIKKAIVDIVTDGVNMIFFGGTAAKKGSGASRVSYGNYYDRRDVRPASTPTQRNRFDHDEIIFGSRGDALTVRTQMEDTIGRYGFVTVADLYELAGLEQPYTSNRYGWTSIRNSEIERVRDGYVIKLPNASPID